MNNNDKKENLMNGVNLSEKKIKSLKVLTAIEKVNLVLLLATIIGGFVFKLLIKNQELGSILHGIPMYVFIGLEVVLRIVMTVKILSNDKEK